MTGLTLLLTVRKCLTFYIASRVFPGYRFHLYHQVVFLHHLHVLFLMQNVINAAELIQLTLDGHRADVVLLRWSEIPLWGDVLIRDTEIIVLFLLLLNRLLTLLLFFLPLLREEESVILPLFPILSLWAEGRLLMLLIQHIILAWRTSTHLFKVRPHRTILLVSKLVI
jgi:hypothetical protein